MELERDVLILPCKHLLLCQNCAKEFEPVMILNETKCPICRGAVEKLEKVYL